MKKTIPHICIGAALAACAHAASLGGDPFPLKFHVEGNRIINELGDEVVFRGLDPEDPVMQAFAAIPGIFGDSSYLPWSERTVAAMSSWGATIINLSIHPASWRVHGKETCLDMLDRAVTAAAAQGMYVLIEFHGIGFPPTGEYEHLTADGYGEIYRTSPAEIEEFWDAVSSRYGGTNVVAFYEIFNEPVFSGFTRGLARPAAPVGDWLTWKGMAEEIIDLIRANDPDAVVMVGGLEWAYDISFAIDHPVERDNIIYSTHPYPDSNWHKPWDDAFGRVTEQYPVFATEFGFDPRGGEKAEGIYPGPVRYRDAIKYYLEEKKISWTAWCFSASWTPALLRDRNYTPSESGEFIRRWLLDGGAPPPVPGIIVNGSEVSLSVPQDEPLTVAVSLDPGGYAGADADWRLHADTPLGPYYYDAAVSPPEWRPGRATGYRGLLLTLPPTEVARNSGLPPGEYEIRFEVDLVPDGTMNGPSYSDRITVMVE
jgi:hypothetical protein